MSAVSRAMRVPAALFCAAAALAAPARAEEAIPVAVLPYAPVFGEFPQSTGDRAASAVANELNAGKQFTVVEVHEGGARARKSEAGDELESARKEVAEAVAGFERAAGLAKSKKMKPAADAYEKAIQQFLLNFQGADSFQPLSEAYLQLSIVRFKLGMEDEAYRLIEDLIRIDPSRTFAPGEVAPVFARIHEKYRSAWLAKERGTVRINSTPAGARVSFDGRELGESPLLARDVLPGEHYVRVDKPGVGAFWKKIRVVSGEELAVAADLAGEATGALALAARGLARNELDEKTAAAVREAGENAKAAFVVFGALHREDDAIAVRSFALQVSDGKVAPLAQLTFDLEMVGAAIEVFKLASDFGEKAVAFPSPGLSLPASLFDDARPPRDALKVAEVSVTPADGKAPTAAASSEEPAERGARRPVGPGGRKPVGGGEEVSSKTEDVPEIVEVRRRPKKAVEPAPEPAPKPKEVEPEKKVTIDDVIAEEDKPKEEKQIDLNVPEKKTKKSANLTPEQLEAMERAANGGSRGSTGKILLWTGVGVAAAAAIGAGAWYFLTPSTPTSAEAHITWTP